FKKLLTLGCQSQYSADWMKHSVRLAAVPLDEIGVAEAGKMRCIDPVARPTRRITLGDGGAVECTGALTITIQREPAFADLFQQLAFLKRSHLFTPPSQSFPLHARVGRITRCRERGTSEALP